MHTYGAHRKGHDALWLAVIQIYYLRAKQIWPKSRVECRDDVLTEQINGVN